MFATVKLAVMLHSVPDDGAATVGAGGRQHLNRAFEAVEGVCLAVHHDLERFGIVVPAGFAFSHFVPLFRPADCIPSRLQTRLSFP